MKKIQAVLAMILVACTQNNPDSVDIDETVAQDYLEAQCEFVAIAPPAGASGSCTGSTFGSEYCSVESPGTSPPYGYASCTDAMITEMTDITPQQSRKLSIDIRSISAPIPEAECVGAKLGATVYVYTSEGDRDVFSLSQYPRVSAGTCTLSPIRFDVRPVSGHTPVRVRVVANGAGTTPFKTVRTRIANFDGVAPPSVECAALDCPLGCSGAGAQTQCRSFDPTGPVTSLDLAALGTSDVTIDESYQFNSDTGLVRRLVNGAWTIIRAASTDPAVMSVSGGIGYRRASDRGIFVFRNLDFVRIEQAAASSVFLGNQPLSLLAREKVAVRGIVSLPCGALGGGNSLQPGPGLGLPGSGAGGAGHAAVGGNGSSAGDGSTGVITPGGGGGQMYGTSSVDSLFGGSKGGMAGALSGGNGGAALQLVAGREIFVGTTMRSSGINAGGCGGGGGGIFAAGGGSGGSVLVEAPYVVMTKNAGFAANGGSGAAVAYASIVDGPFSSTAPTMYTDTQCRSPLGGVGGVSIAQNLNAPSGPASNLTLHNKCIALARVRATPLAAAGGGGGAAGIVRVRTLNADLANRDLSTFLSPEASFATLSLF